MREIVLEMETQGTERAAEILLLMVMIMQWTVITAVAPEAKAVVMIYFA